MCLYEKLCECCSDSWRGLLNTCKRTQTSYIDGIWAGFTIIGPGKKQFEYYDHQSATKEKRTRNDPSISQDGSISYSSTHLNVAANCVVYGSLALTGSFSSCAPSSIDLDTHRLSSVANKSQDGPSHTSYVCECQDTCQCVFMGRLRYTMTTRS